jgi:hypothetical protein
MHVTKTVDAPESRSPFLPLIRCALLTIDAAAFPLLCTAAITVFAIALASLGIAAGGLNFLLGLHYLDYFPTFPLAARILCGLSLLAFAAVLLITALPLWRIFRSLGERFWSWHMSAWRGEAPVAAVKGKTPMEGVTRVLWITSAVFVGIFLIAFALMMILAGGPFWHVWSWFV